VPAKQSHESLIFLVTKASYLFVEKDASLYAAKHWVGLLHHVGGGNLGDDATLDADNTKRRWPNAEIAAFSMNPDDTKTRHGITPCPGNSSLHHSTSSTIRSIDARLLATMSGNGLCSYVPFYRVLFAHLLNKPFLAIAHHPEVTDLMIVLELRIIV
jgi:hypothetical protein